MGKYTKILIGAILLSLANKILLGNLMFISFVEIGLIIYALYWISHLSVLEIFYTSMGKSWYLVDLYLHLFV